VSRRGSPVRPTHVDPATAREAEGRRPWWTLATTLVAGLGTLAAVLTLLFDLAPVETPREPVESPTPTPTPPASAEVRQLAAQVRRLEAEVGSLSKPARNSVLATQLERVDRRLQGVERTSTALREAILPDPERAVQVPLLRQEVDRLETRTEDALDGFERDVDRQFTFITFIVATFGVGLLGQAVRRRRASESQGEDEPKAAAP
jgi:hypothetical protein